MDSIRKWFYRPKKEDKSLLAQFFYADESLNGVACELDSFDGRQEPERCTSLVNQLRHCQDKVLSICNQIMDELIPEARANRDFRVKFPDDVMQENLAGQLWFGAECLAAGSSILNREAESSAMRPLAKALTKSLETVRNLLREQALRGQTNLKAQNPLEPATEKLIESLKIFDRLFADFELCYVGAMVPVKSTKEYEQQELVCVLFSETLQRALERGLLSQADVDNYEPALMFTIPRLAIVAGLLAPPGGPLCLDSASLDSISEMFRPFRSLLLKIRELLWTLNNRELYMLEKLLCSMEDAAPASRPQADQPQQSGQSQQEQQQQQLPDLDEFVHNFYTGYPNCKDFIADFYTVTRNNGSNMDEVANDAVLILEQQPEPTSEPHRRRSPARAEHGQSPQAGLSGTQRHDSSGSSDFYSCDSVSVEITENQLSQTESSASDPLQTDADSAKLISEANKSLSNLLLEADCQNETSEHTDSGICTVISSENTSLYDKSPEEKKSFAHELEQNDNEDSNEPNKNDEPDEIELDEEAGKGDEEEEENTSYSCSNVLNSPKRRDSNKSDNSCVCSSRTSRSSSAYLTNSLEPSKQTPHMSPHLHGSNEEIIGIALGSGQIPVCDGNQPSFQINYTENWENLNINIEASTSRREFWNDLKCESGSSSAQTGKNDKTLVLSQQQQHHHHHHSQQDKLSSKKRKEEKQKRRHHRRMLVYNAGDNSRRRVAYQASLQLPTSTESSRSNSTDRCLNPRLVNFGSSLHPSQNTRQMPNFGARSPHASPRMQHFESKASSKSRRHGVTAPRHQNHQYHQHHQQQQHQHHHQQIVTLTNSSQSRKLLEHRRQRSGEHMQRVKKKDSSRRERGSHKLDNYKKKSGKFAAESDLINDGLGPRTNKSGIVTSEHRASDTSASMEPERQAAQNKQQMFDASTCIRTDLTSSSSCSSCYDSSSETSEFQSDCQDDEEIALAMQAAEIANRNQIRAKFRSSEDLVHRLFVCIAGVADQLQTNFASDLRNILKCVFLMNSSQSIAEDEKIDEPSSNTAIETSAPNSSDDTHEQHLQEPQQLPHSTSNETIVEDHAPTESRNCSMTERGEECVERAPVWVPDSVAPRCMACQAGFTVVRRRHHCRNCGKVFCGRCSSNNVPLPRYGHTKPVRVCNRCFIYQVTPFTVSQVTPTS